MHQVWNIRNIKCLKCIAIYCWASDKVHVQCWFYDKLLTALSSLSLLILIEMDLTWFCWIFFLCLVFINQNTALIVGAGTLLDGAGERDSISISSCQLYYLIKGKCSKKLTDANGEMLIRIKLISIIRSTS